MKFNIKKYMMREWGIYIEKITIQKCWLKIDLRHNATPEIAHQIQKCAEFNWEFPTHVSVG